MTIAVKCDVCGKQYKLSDELAGKVFSCKECGLPLDVPGGRKSRSGEEVIDRRPPKSSATIRSTGGGKHRGKKSQGNPMPMLAVGGGVVLAVIVLGVIFGGGGNRGPSLAPPSQPPVTFDSPTVAGTPTPSTPASATPATTLPTKTTNTPAATGANTAAATPAVNTPAGTDGTPDATAPAANTATTAATPETRGLFTLEVHPGWAVHVDPPAEPLPTEWAGNWKLPVTGRFLGETCISYPATYSPFVVLGTNEDAKASRDVWNLATGQKTSTFKGQTLSTTHPVALSADGRYLAWNDYRIIGVYDLVSKKTLGELPSGIGNTSFNIARLDLPRSDRIVAMSSVNHGFRTWSLPGGELLQTAPLGDKFAYPAKSGYSPGGRYVALESHFLEHNIQVYEVDTGDLVGIINATKIGNTYGDLQGLAFSPDGTQLAAVFDTTIGDKRTQIALWNVADGTQTTNHVIEPGILDRTKTRETAGVQWFADGRKLLIHGVTIVDAETGLGLYELSKPDPSFAGSRRAIGPNGIADLSGTRQQMELKPIVISDDDLGRSALVAAAGGLAIDVRLPALTRAELNAAPGSALAAEWRLTPSGPPTRPAAGGEPLPLKTGKGTLRQLLVALDDQPRAFFKLADGENSSSGATSPPQTTFRVDAQGRLQSRTRPRPIKAKSHWIDVYDLTTKQFLSKIDLPFIGDLIGCSPDGRRILVQPHDAQGRLDVFDVADGQPVVGFRPYQSLADEKDWELAAAVMLDGDHVATLNDDGLFVVWELPACRSLYAVSGVSSFALSPGGQHMALSTATGVDLRQSLTGLADGFVPFQGSIHSLAFHPQGDRLAVMLKDQGGTYVYAIDLKDGQIGEEIPCPVAGGLMWVSDRYLLVEVAGGDRRLFDLEAKTVVWNYLLRDGVVSANSPDPRLWYAVPKSPRVPTLQLVATALPDDAVVKRLSTENPAPELLLQPGGKVSVRMRVTPPPSRAQWENELTSLIHKAVERSGVSSASGQPVELHVTAEGKAGKSIEVKKLGTEEASQVQELLVEIQLAYKRGPETLWQDQFNASNTSGFIIKRIAEGESVQAAFDKDLWDRVTRYSEGLQLPAYLFATKSVQGLGSSTLGPNGPIK